VADGKRRGDGRGGRRVSLGVLKGLFSRGLRGDRPGGRKNSNLAGDEGRKEKIA